MSASDNAHATGVVGIDLGTTYSLAAAMVDGEPRILSGQAGKVSVPSVIHIAPDGSVTVGKEARDLAASDPSNTLHSIKRLMGRSIAETREEAKNLPYPVEERVAGDGRSLLAIRAAGKLFTPEELSAKILAEVRRRAGNPTRAVITVPAYFDDSQRQATRDAARIAGLEVLRIVNEPTAAALAYGLDRRRQGTVAVYDLGGGTFDCSILSIREGVFKVLSTRGDTRLGGDDFDRVLSDSLLSTLPPGKITPALLSAARDAAEACKISLSSNERATLTMALPEGGNLEREWTRAQFEQATRHLVHRSLDKCRAALRDAQLEPSSIDEVVMVGGSTRIPLVRSEVEAFFGRKPHVELNPDEVVALGAAIQADLLTGGKRRMLLLDVVPLSLGIETLGGAVTKLIHRNTTIPARATDRFTTGVDNQTSIIVTICQGERELVKDCRILGKFKLSGIPPMPAQMAQVDVTFLVDANGLLTVSARELRSGQKAEVTVTPSHGLTNEEVEDLVLESVTHAREDHNARRFIELGQKASSLASHTRRVMDSPEVMIESAEREAIEKALAEIDSAQASGNGDRLNMAINGLNEATQGLAGRMMDAAASQVLRDKRMEEVKAASLR
ncbi:MAG: Fe-S protein assembly chaperone HscA [Gemmataceae bacterium]|nr:Fe-S protein assembly chaperone HscA [Gemmataceae bacterium]